MPDKDVLKELKPGQSIVANVRRQGADYVLDALHIETGKGKYHDATNITRTGGF